MCDVRIQVAKQEAPAALVVHPPTKTTRAVTPQIPAPPAGTWSVRVAIITISDRVAKGAYDTGDLPGPAVEEAVTAYFQEAKETYLDSQLVYEILRKAAVPDDTVVIQSTLRTFRNE